MVLNAAQENSEIQALTEIILTKPAVTKGNCWTFV